MPSRMRITTMASASFQPKENSAKSVMMLLRPSFMPGTGKGMGICASSTKIASAMAVSSAQRVSRFTRMAVPPLPDFCRTSLVYRKTAKK